jgi:hypothetical membrane protein
LKKSSSKTVSILSIISMTGVVLFWVVLFIAQSLKPEYNPVRRSISDLAIGPYDWLQTINFLLLALAAASIGFGIYHGLPNIRFRKTVLVLFLALAFGEIISAIFEVDLDKTHLTVPAVIHQAGAMITAVAVPFAALFILPGLKADPRWRGLVNFTLGVAISMLALDIAREALLFTDWMDPWFGLYEKTLLALALVWIWVLGFRLWRANRNLKQDQI